MNNNLNPVSDALAKKLGMYQKMSSVCKMLGAVAAILIIAVFFAVQNKVVKATLDTVLFFAAFGLIYAGNSLYKKMRETLKEQLGGFFGEEFEKAYGKDECTDEMRIDEALVKKVHLLDEKWEECRVENYHEGRHNGTRFSAANVILNHVYTANIVHEGKETRRNIVFQGLVFRCETKTQCSPISIVKQADDSIADENRVSYSFSVSPGTDDGTTFRLTEIINNLDRELNGEIFTLYLEDGVLTVALKTDYAFAEVADNVSMENIDAVKQSYMTSLREFGHMLETVIEKSELFNLKG